MAENAWFCVWSCPTCGKSGTADAPTFSRCFDCDSRRIDAPAIEWRSNLQRLLDWTHEDAIIRVIEIIEEEMQQTTPQTGHGKAQRAFGNKILRRLKEE